MIIDPDGCVMHAAGGAFETNGLDPDTWFGLPVQEVLPVGAVSILMPRVRAALAGDVQSFGYRALSGDRDYWVEMTPVRDRAGILRSVVAVTRDITEQLTVSADLARSEARLREAERLIGVGSWEMALSTCEITFSGGLARLLGLAPDTDLSLEEHVARVHVEDRERLTRTGRTSIASGQGTCEYRYTRPDGETRILSLRAEVVHGASGRREYLRGAILDVTERRRSEREHNQAEARFRQGFDATAIGAALVDPGTGCCVRVNDAMCRLLARSREELLGTAIQTLSHPDDRDAVEQAAARMLDGDSSDFQVDHRFLRPEGGIGWARLHFSPVRRDDGSVEVFYCQLIDIQESKDREVQLEDDVAEAMWLRRIRDALDEDRFVLYSQPIVDLLTGHTVQHELLLRMRGEDGLIIAPNAFLPVAERYGLISEIDRWVIREAVAIAAAGTPTEFNLSGRSIGDPLVIAELADAIDSSGVDPSLLCVEVTETAFIDQVEAGREFARRVRELGCRLALDDFGTGFSSLSYLKHIPADHLKIDIEFVRELTRSETDARVIRGIVGLAREFRQTTVAEGVEDEATLIMLRELGVDLVQGYLFGRPAPREGAPAPRPAARPARPGGTAPADPADPAELVREALNAFNRQDVHTIVEMCTPDVVLRPLVTGRVSDQPTTYRGVAGVHAYISDVNALFDAWTLIPLTLRASENSVIAFGRIDARRGDEWVNSSAMWVVKIEDDRVASIEVFKGADARPELGPAELRRLVAPEAPTLSR